MKRSDYVLIAVLIAIGLLGICVVAINWKNGEEVIVYSEGECIGIYSLLEDKNISVDTLNGGRNTVVIRNNSVYIEEANCPDKICINQGMINKSQQSICCAPNRLIVIVTTTQKGEYDAITQ